ncbi:MAG: dienelactone hydrolase family protein [Chitinophagaceae bacterium]|nr:dienelactone hydrolase family protein [Chitinophagaceae bacterium]
MKTLLQLTALLLLQLTLSAQQVAKSLTATNGTFIGFYEYKPTNYNASGPKYPVIIFMHGIGERGNGTTELSRVAANGIPKYIAQGNPMRFTWNGKTETFLVLSPQLSSAWGYWPNFYPEEMIKYAKANLNIDTNRIIVTGLSLGGGGVWQYASASSENGRTAAAIAPVCGTCNMQVAANIAKANLPLWAFHAQNDGTVSVGVQLTRCLSSVSRNSHSTTKTIYADGGHSIWDRAYDTVYNWQNPNVYEWFLGQNKSLAPNILPVANAGSNITISTSKATVNLSGVLSTDADGTIVRYIWTKVSGPATGTIVTPVSTTGSTVINNLTLTGTYIYQLKVVDDRASVATSTITVTVTNGVVANIPPVAEAGIDISTTSASANLNGQLPTIQMALSQHINGQN